MFLKTILIVQMDKVLTSIKFESFLAVTTEIFSLQIEDFTSTYIEHLRQRDRFRLKIVRCAYRISSYKTRGYYYFTWPSNAGFRQHYIFNKYIILELQGLFKGGTFMRKYGI